MRNPITKQELENLPKVEGLNCPNCGKFSYEDHCVLGQTEAKFIEAPDPHFSWKEKYQCPSCETIYIINNGT